MNKTEVNMNMEGQKTKDVFFIYRCEWADKKEFKVNMNKQMKIMQVDIDVQMNKMDVGINMHISKR